MNKLELVQRLHRKCGVTGDAPTTLAEQPEETNRLIDWINEAWMDIQLQREDWYWMENTFSFECVNGQTSYTPAQCGIDDFGNWSLDNFRNYPTATGQSGEIFMEVRTWPEVRDLYYFGGNRWVYSRPDVVAVKEDKSLALGPIGASGWTVTGSYFAVASELDDEGDEPSLPSQFHMAIVYRAMMFYGVYEAAQEVYTEGENEFNRMLSRITRNQLPRIVMGAPLA